MQPYVLLVVNLVPPKPNKQGGSTPGTPGSPAQAPLQPASIDTLAAFWATSAYKQLAKPFRKNVKVGMSCGCMDFRALRSCMPSLGMSDL